MACKALLNNDNLKVVWIDSGNSGFLVDQAKFLLQHNPAKMEHFMYQRSHCLSELMSTFIFLLQHSGALGESSNLLIVIDSITQSAWASFSDWDRNTAVHSEMLRELSGLVKRMASDLDASVLMTNNAVKDNMDEGVSLYKRALGKLWDISDNIIECTREDSSGRMHNDLVCLKVTRSKRFAVSPVRRKIDLHERL